MPFTQADIDALKEAVASGVLTATYADGRSVTYRSLKEMKETLAMMEAEVAPAKKPVRAFRVALSSGY
ncbi:MAG TPA: hypothetical protein PKZ99_10975 [Azospirillaceae bacterium]|nr:hypothetical protein [Azospirillaceae bacterium]